MSKIMESPFFQLKLKNFCQNNSNKKYEIPKNYILLWMRFDTFLQFYSRARCYVRLVGQQFHYNKDNSIIFAVDAAFFGTRHRNDGYLFSFHGYRFGHSPPSDWPATITSEHVDRVTSDFFNMVCDGTGFFYLLERRNCSVVERRN